MNTVCQLIRFIGPEEDVGYKLTQLKEYIKYAACCARPPYLVSGNFPVNVQYEPISLYARSCCADEIDLRPTEIGCLVQINDCFKRLTIGQVMEQPDCLLRVEYDFCELE